MRTTKIIKSAGLILTILVFASGIFFTSSSTIEESNSQAINQLFAELDEVSAEIKALEVDAIEETVCAEPFIGQIAIFAGNFAPRGWAFCDGTLLPVFQNTRLFSLLGTTYGGDGRTTFALPDLRGRIPIHQGQGPGLTPHDLGQKFGYEQTHIRTTRTPVFPGSGTDVESVVTGIGYAGDGQVEIVQPGIAVNYIIALEGTYPSRS